MKPIAFSTALLLASTVAPVYAATVEVNNLNTTINFQSDCADCSLDHGPGTIASASLTLQNLNWVPVETTEYSGFSATFDSVVSFSYHSDWLTTLAPQGISNVEVRFFSSDISSPFTNLDKFSIRFENTDWIGDATFQRQFIFTGTNGSTWDVYYTPWPQDYGDLKPGAWQVASVPEPETYAMLLAGLGLLAGVARRRKMITA